MLPFPSVYDFRLQKDIPVFCRNVNFFPWRGMLLQTESVDWSHSLWQIVNLFRLEFQVLWHIPEMAVALVNGTGYISCTLPQLEVHNYVICLTPLSNIYQSKLQNDERPDMDSEHMGHRFCARSSMFMCISVCIWTIQQHLNTGSLCFRHRL